MTNEDASRMPETLKQVAEMAGVPLGGIGAGCVELGPTGRFL